MLNLALRFFQVCGLYPVNFRKLDSFNNYQKNGSIESYILKLCTGIHFSVVVALILFVSINNKELLYGETAIGNLNDALILFSVFTAHLSIVIESFTKRKYFISYWRFFAKMKGNSVWHRKVFLKMFIPFLFAMSTEIVIISNIGEDQQWTIFWFLQIYSLMVTRIRFLQHIFFIDIIFYSLEDLNCHLRSTAAWTRAIGADKNFARNFFYKNVSQSQENFKSLMKMLIKVNKAFGWSQALNVGQLFIEATCDFFWIYVFAIGPTFLWGKYQSIESIVQL